MRLMMRDYSEKRDYIRMKVEARIELRFSNPNQVLYGICKDLSGTGMAIEVEESIPMDTEFNTCLPSQNENFPPFETRVKVIRNTELDDGKYLIGVEIVQVNN